VNKRDELHDQDGVIVHVAACCSVCGLPAVAGTPDGRYACVAHAKALELLVHGETDDWTGRLYRERMTK